MLDTVSFFLGAMTSAALIAAFFILRALIADAPRPADGLHGVRARWIGRTNRRLDDLEMALAMRMCRGEPVPDRVVLPTSPEKRVTLRAIEREIEMDPDVELDAVFDCYPALCGREKEALRAAILARQPKG